MIEPIGSLSVEVIPQAIVAMPVSQVVGRKADLVSGEDDFDFFEGASFRLDRNIEIAVRHYRGHPRDTTTIYIDRRQNDVEQITRLIQKILFEFSVPEQALRWQRRDDPGL